MPSLPDSSNKTNWGTAYNDFLNVGHDSDGTHKKSQMLTDMGWSPTAAEGSTVTTTLPNGLILKWGVVTGISGDSTGTQVTFGTAFPTGCLNVQCTTGMEDGGTATCNGVVRVRNLAAGSFYYMLYGRDACTRIYWFAVGY